MNNALAVGQEVDAKGKEEVEEKMTSEQWEDLWVWADVQHNVNGTEVLEGKDLGDSEEEEFEGEEEEEEEDEEEGGGEMMAEDKGKGMMLESGEQSMPLEDILRYVHSGGVLNVGGPPLMG